MTICMSIISFHVCLLWITEVNCFNNLYDLNRTYSSTMDPFPNQEQLDI